MDKDRKARSFMSVPTGGSIRDSSELERLNRDYVGNLVQKTRKYASYQLKTCRLMQREQPSNAFLFDNYGRSLEQ